MDFLTAFFTWLHSASNGAILISAMGAFLVASISIRHQRKLARERATFDLINRAEEPLFKKHGERFYTLADDPDYLREMVRCDSPGDQAWDDKQEFLAVLNHYELVALGIHSDVLDEALYKRWMQMDVVEDWEAAKPFIEEMHERDGSTVAFECFGELAVRWGAKPVD